MGRTHQSWGHSALILAICTIAVTRACPETSGNEIQGEESLPELIKLLDDASTANRIQAIRAIGNLGTLAENAAPALLGKLEKDPVSLARWFAADALVKVAPGDPRVIPALTSALRDPDSFVRGAAARNLGLYGPRLKAVVPELLTVLSDPQTAKQAAEALIQIDSDNRDAISVLSRHMDSRVAEDRLAGAASLRLFGSRAKAAVPKLVAALSDPDRGAQFGAALALSSIDTLNPAPVPILMAAILAKEDVGFLLDIAPVAIITLGPLATGRVGPAFDELRFVLLDLRHQQRSITEHRKQAAQALWDLGELARPAIPALKGALRDPDLLVRRAASETLQRIEDLSARRKAEQLNKPGSRSDP